MSMTMEAVSSEGVSKLKSMATILIFGLVMAIGIAATVTISAFYMSTIRIGSAAYNDIVQTKDLVADILPPPEYIIEPYLEVNRLFNHSESLADFKSHMKKLRGDYDDRHNYWIKSNLDPDIKKKLTETSHAYVTKFWDAVDQKFLPAVERKDDAKARASFNELTTDYQAHRAIIDEIVNQANALYEKVEAAAEHQGKVAIWSIGVVDGALFVLLIAGIVTIARRLVKPLRALGAGLERLSKGDMSERLSETFPPEYRQLQDNYNIAIEQMQSILGSVKSSGREVTNASAEISTSTTDLSQRTEEQAASLEETSAAMEELSATVKKNAENAQQANSPPAPPERSPTVAGRWWRKPCRPWPRSKSPRAKSPTSSASLTRSRARPTCSRLTRRSRPRAPVRQAAASRWWRPKCAAWRSVRRRPPRTSPA